MESREGSPPVLKEWFPRQYKQIGEEIGVTDKRERATEEWH